MGALYVDEHFYYSTYERDGNEKRYTLQKCYKDNGVKIVTVVGFDHVRGISRDESDNIYVVDSVNSRVLKFDSDLTPLLKTCTTAKIFQEPYGIVVTDEYIIVCGHDENRITIFHHNLDVYCHKKTPKNLTKPTDITVLNGIYFVTAYAAIAAITIDFDAQTFEAVKIKGVYYNKTFRPFSEAELRGICADGQYLYVTQLNSALLCLKYDRKSKKLYFISSIRCSPITVAHHNGTIYFSRTTKDDFHIAKVTKNCSEHDMSYEDLFKV